MALPTLMLITFLYTSSAKINKKMYGLLTYISDRHFLNNLDSGR